MTHDDARSLISFGRSARPLQVPGAELKRAPREGRSDVLLAGVSVPESLVRAWRAEAVRRAEGFVRLEGAVPTESGEGPALPEGVDRIVLPEGDSLGNYAAAFFDMDGTVIENECLDELAALCGAGERVEAETRRAMDGRLPFEASLRSRVAHLRGAPDAILKELPERLRLRSGISEWLGLLRACGVRTYLLTGGFLEVAGPVAQRLGMTGVVANRLVVRSARLTGEVTGPEGGPILDGAGKLAAMRRIAASLGEDLPRVMAFGDGANDLPMVTHAGFGCAVRPKAVLLAASRHAVRFGAWNCFAKSRRLD